MRLETRTYEVFPIWELTDKAKDRAYSDWLTSYDYSFDTDNEATLKAFCRTFGIVCHDWQYDAYTYNYRFRAESAPPDNICGTRLIAYLHNNFNHILFPPKSYWKNGKDRRSRIFKDTCCPLTGYYIDNHILGPIYEFLSSRPDPRITFDALMDKCLDSFFAACRNDIESCTSMEYFTEDSQANEREYLSNGKLFS